MNKGLLAVVLSFVLLLSACSGGVETADTPSESSDPVANEVATEGSELSVDKGLIDVKIHIPASLVEFSDGAFNEPEDMTQSKFKSFERNADGSVTVTISRADHKELMEALYESTSQSLDSLASDGTFASIKSIEHSKDFSVIEITVNQEAFENSFDSIGLFSAGVAGMMYRAFDGSDTNVEIKLIDESTGDVYKTIHYPDDLGQGGSDSDFSLDLSDSENAEPAQNSWEAKAVNDFGIPNDIINAIRVVTNRIDLEIIDISEIIEDSIGDSAYRFTTDIETIEIEIKDGAVYSILGTQVDDKSNIYYLSDEFRQLIEDAQLSEYFDFDKMEFTMPGIL